MYFLFESVLLSPNPINKALKKLANMPIIIKALTPLIYPAPRTPLQPSSAVTPKGRGNAEPLSTHCSKRPSRHPVPLVTQLELEVAPINRKNEMAVNV